MKYITSIFLIIGAFIFHSCGDLEADVFDEITPETFYNNDVQIAAALSAAYTPLYSYWGYHSLSELTTDQSAVPIRSNGGWNDGGLWPKLVRHEFNERDFVGGDWNRGFNGVGACNRLIEIIADNVGPDAPAIDELKALRAFYYYRLLDQFGNIPIVTSFSEADASPQQSSAPEVFAFVEQELLSTIPNLTEDKNISTYAKMNRWVAYTLLAELYINAERFDVEPHYQEAADAANEVINSGKYSLESGYFANFRINNEGSNENIFVIPFDKNNATGFNLWSGSLNQSARPTFNFSGQPWGGFSFQEDFYNAFDENDKRRGIFIVGQQYTIEAQPTWSDSEGFFYALPDEQFQLSDCTEDFNRLTEDELAEELDGQPEDCNIFITPSMPVTQDRGIVKYESGTKYGKYELELNSVVRNMSNDWPIFRFAHVLLIRAEALWRMSNGNAEALTLVNQIRDRAGLDALTTLTEDDLYWEFKKELALEMHARSITIRYGHWEDAWFQKDANPGEEFKRFYPIPAVQLQANVNLNQNPGY